MIPWICLLNITCVVIQQIAILLHFHLNAAMPKWNELTKWPLFGHLSKFVIKFRMQVWGNDSMDLFTLHHVFCDTADRHTFSHFHLNASWGELNALTKWSIFGHLSKFIIKYRLQVSGSDSVDLFTQQHLCCDIANLYTFSHFHLNVYYP